MACVRLIPILIVEIQNRSDDTTGGRTQRRVKVTSGKETAQEGGKNPKPGFEIFSLRGQAPEFPSGPQGIQHPRAESRSEHARTTSARDT